MAHNSLIGKIAADKDSNKLGKIVRIDKILGKTIKKKELNAMILVHRFLKKDLLIPVALKKVLKVEGNYVWFDITKKDFISDVKYYETVIKERETPKEFVSTTTNWFEGQNVDRRPKPKQRK